VSDFHGSKNRRRLLGLSFGFCLSPAFAAAQVGPNLSGTWEQISSSDPAITGQEQTVIHTPTTLTVGHPSPRGGHKFVYKLDGTESRSTLMNIESVARVSVERDKLTIARIDTYPDGRIRENTQIWSLDPAGNLVIQSTDGLKGGTSTARKLVYKKRTLTKH
jgi:hypothetical protein